MTPATDIEQYRLAAMPASRSQRLNACVCIPPTSTPVPFGSIPPVRAVFIAPLSHGDCVPVRCLDASP